MNQAQRAFLEVKTSANPGVLLQRYWLNEPMTLIGRLEANQPGLHLNDEHISRQHAQLICQNNPGEQGYWLQNLRGKGLVRIYNALARRKHQSFAPTRLCPAQHFAYTIGWLSATMATSFHALARDAIMTVFSTVTQSTKATGRKTGCALERHAQ